MINYFKRGETQSSCTLTFASITRIKYSYKCCLLLVVGAQVSPQIISNNCRAFCVLVQHKKFSLQILSTTKLFDFCDIQSTQRRVINATSLIYFFNFIFYIKYIYTYIYTSEQQQQDFHHHCKQQEYTQAQSQCILGTGTRTNAPNCCPGT